jgi:hypothetical protein
MVASDGVASERPLDILIDSPAAPAADCTVQPWAVTRCTSRSRPGASNAHSCAGSSG